MTTTVRFSDELLRKAKRNAAEKGQTLIALIKEGIRIVLAGPRRPRRRTYVQLPVSTASGGRLPGIDLNRSSDLEDQMRLLSGT